MTTQKPIGGTWRVVEDEEGIAVIGDRIVCILTTGNIVGAGHNYGEEMERRRAETLATAQLISTAPALLEALKKSVETLRDIQQFFKAIDKPFAADAAAIAIAGTEVVIAKAEGRHVISPDDLNQTDIP
jgi:hypothetical protein